MLLLLLPVASLLACRRLLVRCARGAYVFVEACDAIMAGRLDERGVGVGRGVGVACLTFVAGHFVVSGS